MLKKTLPIGLLSFLCASPCFSSFSGFYGGAAIGPEGASFTQRAHVIIPRTVNVSDLNHFAGLGVFGSLFAGYGLDYNCFNLAAEVNVNISSLEYLLKNNEYVHNTFNKTTFRFTNSEGISFLPGYYFSETSLFYGRLGYINGRLKIHESDPTINSMTRNLNGFRYGLGIKQELNPNFAFMMDYSQVHYEAAKSRVIVPQATLTKNTEIIPNTGQVAFGLIYKCDAPEVFVK